MCGIVGYLGKGQNITKIVEKLERLEYRGYDSAGVMAINDKKEITLKSVGNIAKLKEVLPSKFETKMAIAHTRWATHGKPDKINCHPHSSKNGEWVIAHNGIIENYLEIKQNLVNKPESDTDTSVLAELLEEKNAKDLKSFVSIFSEVVGSFAIVAIKKNQNCLYLAKRKSPLYVAKNEREFIIASDPICFSDETNVFYSLEDNEFAKIENNEIVFVDKHGKKVQKTLKNIKKIDKKCENSKKIHFMLKEIEEQSQVLSELLNCYKREKVLNKFNKNYFNKINSIKLIGCGTAYHACLMGVEFLSEVAGVNATAEIASEFIYKKMKFIDEKTLVIAVSQSGETADTLKAVEIAKSVGATTIALTNVEYSTLAGMVDCVLPVCAGVEKAVASTKAYTCQLLALYLVAKNIDNLKNNKNDDIFDEVENELVKLTQFDKDLIDKIADEIKNRNDVIFIGKGADFVTAQEASLKLKEVTYINSASYPSGELKHGYLALVQEGTPVFVFANDEDVCQKTLNAAAEAQARGANVKIITNLSLEKSAKIIKNSCKNKFLSQIASIIPMQYLAFRVSVLKNINPDQPRNLAKSVTVE